jgi:hypothetical protein
MEFDLIPIGTRITVNGDGQPQDVQASQTRTFLCTLVITDQIEQESLDVSIWGSEDGQNWGEKPLLKMPQCFYRGETRQILDLTLKPEVKFLRARGEVVRWGRVAPTPMFVIGFHLKEVPAFAHAGPAAKAPAATC